MRRTVATFVIALTITLALACRTNQSPERQVRDAAITAEVKKKLAEDVRLATLTNVDVNSTNGVVTLAGQSRSDEERHKIEEVARSVHGVVRVNNNVQVVNQ